MTRPRRIEEVRPLGRDPDRDKLNFIFENLNQGIGLRFGEIDGIGPITAVVYTVGIEDDDGNVEYDQETIAVIANPALIAAVRFPDTAVESDVRDASEGP